MKSSREQKNKQNQNGLHATFVHILVGQGELPEDGEMSEMTLPSDTGFEILRPSTLPLGHGGSTILSFTRGWEGISLLLANRRNWKMKTEL